MECEVSVADDDRVAGVVPAGAAGHDVDALRREKVDELA
jgi:hypothetical protein